MFSLLISLTSADIFAVFISDPQLVALIQIKNILAPGVADPHGTWRNCKLDIKSCSANQLSTMQGKHFGIMTFSHLSSLIPKLNKFSKLLFNLRKVYKIFPASHLFASIDLN